MYVTRQLESLTVKKEDFSARNLGSPIISYSSQNGIIARPIANCITEKDYIKKLYSQVLGVSAKFSAGWFIN